ncbi:MAG: IS481 family transposase [Thermoplasmataceae archaeon]
MLSTDDKRFILQSVEGGYKVRDLARMFSVTPRRIQQIIREGNSATGERRKESIMPESTAKEIEDLWNSYKIGSRTIFYLLKSKGRDISYYQIYNYMRSRNMIRNRRPGTTQGREMSLEPPFNTLFMDYHQSSMDSPYALICIDMSTRKVLSLIESRKITKELVESTVNSIASMVDKNRLKINRLILRDGVLSVLYGATDLKYTIQKVGVDNVETDRSGSKFHLSLSRFWQNYDRFRWTFSKPESFVFWYNNRPIMRFENKVTTPEQIMEQYLVERKPPLNIQRKS